MPVISTNTAANTALRYLNINSDNQSDSLAKISSGRRIETASDDAAGLAVSTSLSSDISVLEQSALNADQGVSVLQTADGALARMDDVLQRMAALSAQSINGGISDTEREYIDAEFQELVDELDSIANSTNFVGEPLLTGSYDQEYLLGTDGSTAGANSNRLSVQIEDFRTGGLEGFATVSTGDNLNAGGTIDAAADYSDGNAVVVNLTDSNGDALDPAQDMVFVWAPDDSNGSDDIDITDEGFIQVDYTAATGQIQIHRFDGSATGVTEDLGANPDLVLDANSTVNNLLDVINSTGVASAGVDSDGTLVVKSLQQGGYFGYLGLDAIDADFDPNTDGVGAGAAGTTIDITGDAYGGAAGAASNFVLGGSIADANADGITGDYISVDSVDNAETAANVIDGAIQQIAEQRAEIGAQISRFEFRGAVIDTSLENLKAARSVILDVDIAAENTEFTNYQTLTDASVALLASANELPQELLRLLQ